MNCVACGEPMLALELEGVEIDHCLACGGIWLDRGELEALIGNSDRAYEVIHSLVPTPVSHDRRRACPLCDRKMDKVALGPFRPEVVIDRCPAGEGLWLERGKLRQILAGSGLAPDSKVQVLLRDMFGLEEH